MTEKCSFDTTSERERFLDILKQYEKLVFSICFQMTGDYFESEDLTQETFLAVFKALPSFDGEYTKAFVTKIAVNKCLDYQKRAERRNVVTEDEGFEEIPSTMAEPEEVLVERELELALEKGCDSLKSPYQEVAYAYYCKGQTTTEIAKLQRKSKKTIQTQLRRAKEMLKQYLKGGGYL